MRTNEDPLDTEQFKISLLTHLRGLVRKVKTHAERSVRSYERYHDRTAKAPPSVQRGDQVYVQRPSNYALASEEREKNARRSKLLPKSIGPFRVTSVRNDVVTIDRTAYATLYRSIASSLYQHGDHAGDHVVGTNARASSSQPMDRRTSSNGSSHGVARSPARMPCPVVRTLTGPGYMGASSEPT